MGYDSSMRALTAFLLSLLLTVTSVTMAVARADEPMAGQTLTLCADGGTVTVTLDANGNPMPPHVHLCPDCLSAVGAATMPGPLVAPARPLTRATLLPLPQPRILASLARQTAHARDPPALFA